MPSYRRSYGINLVGWGVCVSNILLFVSYYYIILTLQTPAPTKFITFLSFLAVFPLDFFQSYLSDMWFSHFFWMLIIITCGMGMLLLNQLARLVFIIVNIVHMVLFASMTFMQFGQAPFLDYCFKLYMIIVVCGAYVGFLTIPDVREQFKYNLEGIRFNFGFERFRPLKTVPKDSLGYYNLGLAYNRIGRFSDAVQSLEKAVELAPKNAKYLYDLGLAYSHLQKNHEAIQVLKETCQLNPGNFQARYLLGQIYLQEGCHPEAVSALEQAVKIQPRHFELNKQLGKAYLAMDKHIQALEAFQRAAGIDFHDPEILYDMGVIYKEKLNKLKEAHGIFLRAVKIKPDFTEAQFSLGQVCISLERYKDALRALKEVIRLDAEHKEAHYQVGFTYAMLKDFDSARREYHFLKRVDQDLAENLAMLIK